MILNKTLISLRTLLRKLGVIRYFVKSPFYKIFVPKKYEYVFDKAMDKYLKKGMLVFDIGANVGYYTSLFLNKVGESGKVIAFEPSKEAAEQIRNNYKNVSNSIVIEKALGNYKGTINFQKDISNLSSPSNRVLKEVKEINHFVEEVEIDTLDQYSKEFGIPNFLKIDVEGHELDVIQGAKETLSSYKLKHLFIEIHYSILERNGNKFAPLKIKNILKANGYKIKYLDISHIHAFRDN